MFQIIVMFIAALLYSVAIIFVLFMFCVGSFVLEKWIWVLQLKWKERRDAKRVEE